MAFPTRFLTLALLAQTSVLSAQTPQKHDPAHNHEEEVIPLDEVVITAPLERPLHEQAQAASIMAATQLTALQCRITGRDGQSYAGRE
ncbi:MAG: hypothetical protein IPK32_18960 [Verrucomicrobiaceae bacterium]|nr:hypothetical protein [Verrucomicrobiaceae bacterium]